jgi:hypothetical protein
MARISGLPCALCDKHPPSVVHHIRTGQGTSQRASHYLTVPLCPDCHTGPGGIHGDRSQLRVRKLHELDLLARAIEWLAW